MKKILSMVALIAILIVFGTTDTFAQNRSFYYYPTSNIYYDISAKQYVYYNGGNWTTAKTLPSGITLVKGAPRTIVNHTGHDVWENNSAHVNKYKNQRSLNTQGKRKAPKGKTMMKKMRNN